MTEEMRRLVEEQRLAFVATVNADGTPNLSPKGSIRVVDEDHLMFADLRSPRTLVNIERSPAIEVNVVDPFGRRGYRFSGTARVLREGELHARLLGRLRATTERPERIRAIVLIRVLRAAPLTSPAYDTGATEAELRARWWRHYRRVRG